MKIPENPPEKADLSGDIVIFATQNSDSVSNEEEVGYGGLAYLKRSAGEKARYVLSFDGGNSFDLSKTSPVTASKIRNALDYDVCVLGTEECSGGAEALNEYLSLSDSAFTACNLKFVGESALTRDRISKYEIIDCGDRKIGVVGVMDPYNEHAEELGILLSKGDELVSDLSSAIVSCKDSGAERIILVTSLSTDDYYRSDWTKTSLESSNAVVREYYANSTPSLIHSVSGIDVAVSAKTSSTDYRIESDSSGNDVLLISCSVHFSNVGQILISSDGYLTTDLIGGSYFKEKDSAVSDYVAKVTENPEYDGEAPSVSSEYSPDSGADGDVVFIFTNDMHAKFKKNMGIAGLSALKNRLAKQTENLVLVDSGDSYERSKSNGFETVALMNYLGYSFGTYGNNEFDLNNSDLREVSETADFTYVCANLKYVGNDPDYTNEFASLKTHAVAEYGNRKIGFVGLTTTKSVKQHNEHFLDGNGEFVYDFGQKSDNDMAKMLQEAIDACRSEGAEYVIVLSHAGVSKTKKIVSLVSGADIVFDGHTHTVEAYGIITDKDGKAVHVASTGCHFLNVGKAVITESGFISTGLVSSELYTERDTEILNILSE